MGSFETFFTALLRRPSARSLLLLAITTTFAVPFSAAQTADPPHTSRTGSTDARQLFNDFLHEQQKIHTIAEVALSPNGHQVAWSAQAPDGSFRITLAAATPDATGVRVTAGDSHGCYEGEPRWSPDGTALAFLSDCASSGQLEVYVALIANATPGAPERLTDVHGPLSHLHWSPDGRQLAFVFVPDAHRAPNPMAAEGRAVGVIDDLGNTDIQRIATVDRHTHAVNLATPPNLYAFEYDWSPDSHELAYIAAPPPGDDNWYVASLYRQALGSAQPTQLFHPQQQIALPRWSPDGHHIAFIQGLMSDQGGTGGEIYLLDTGKPATAPENLTPKRAASPSWFTWRPDGTLVFTEFTGGSEQVNTLDPHSRTVMPIWHTDASLHATNEETSLSVAADTHSLTFATSRYGWSSLPEVWLVTGDRQAQLTHLNRDVAFPLPRAENLTWTSAQATGTHTVQGWLLYPRDFDPHQRYPLLVHIHGGPAWITTPSFEEPNFNATAFAQFGYFVFFPNPRGSYGQGEAFTQANRRDWGFGDLQDTLRGVDTVLAHVPVDARRVGLLGWSYGGSTAMFAGTQTDRFRALVAGAGAADWLSYYGQNGIDQWMKPYFGASPYEDPEAYRRTSAMTWITKTHTPTLVLVGERDGEAPPAQSFQFWHALKELHVPTQLVVYPDEGHAFTKQDDRVDVMVRTLDWFQRYMPPAP